MSIADVEGGGVIRSPVALGAQGVTELPQKSKLKLLVERSAFHRRLRLEADALDDALVQWAWFAFGIPADRVGMGFGPLTWMRRGQHRRLKRDLHIALVCPEHRGLPFAPLTAWAINEGSRRCTASVNTDLERADVIWVYAQDPFTPAFRAVIEEKLLREARPDASIINAPHAYNAFHRADAFEKLTKEGVRVPRFVFGPEDVGVTPVVYKTNGQQGADKYRALYDGPKPGMAPFEFVDSTKADGSFRRYRAHYLAGMVRPAEVLVSNHWNACMRNSADIEYSFSFKNDEEEQIHRIATALDLQYFAVDYLRRNPDGEAVFTDVNIYPTIRSPRARVRGRGDYGGWHTFDARRRLGIPEPQGVEVWDQFDDAMMAFVNGHQHELGAICAAAE
jgi:hypothetical protein